MDNLLSALYSFPGAYLSEKIGFKRALLVFNLVAMAGFLVVILVPSWPAVLVGAVFFLSWTAISLPATMSLVASVLPTNKRTMGVSMHSFVRRIPMALGPIIGGVCISIWGIQGGVRAAFVAALLMSTLAALLQQALIEEPEKPDPGTEGPQKNPLRLLKLMSPSLKKLLAADIMVRFCEQIPYAFVVVWCMNRVAQPVTAPQFGILTAIEMATAMLVYIPVAYFADKSQKKPFIVITFGFFTVFPLVLMFSQSFLTLAFAFFIRGLKEFGEPTRKALIMDLAPEDKKAAMFGVYYLLRDVVVSLAAFGGAFLWQISPVVNFGIAIFFGLAGTLFFAIWGSDLIDSHD